MKLTKSLKRTAAPILISRFVQLEFGALGRKIARAFGYQTPANIALEEIKILEPIFSQFVFETPASWV